jgi:hypothetical protein
LTPLLFDPGRGCSRNVDLEIDWPKRGTVTVDDPPDSDDARLRAIVRDELRDVLEILERIERGTGAGEPDGQTG